MKPGLFDSSILASTQQAVEFVSNILESSTEYSVIGKDLDGKILLWNEGARRMYGYDAEEVVGKLNSEILHIPEDVAAGKPRAVMEAALRDGKWEGVLGRIRKDARRISAVFHLYLPAAQGARQETTPQPSSSQLQGHGERVLYVDDEEPLVFLMTRMLTKVGYKVTGCTEPKAALESFRSAPNDFDVVVSDLSMPQMSGIDLAREVLQIRPGMPILIASGYIHPADNEKVRSLGLPDLLLKPDTIEALAQHLYNIFAKSQASDSGEQPAGNSKVRGQAASSS